MAIPDGLLQSIDSLDPMPITAQRLIRAVDDENTGPAQLAAIVEYDPAVASGVLRVANSAAYGGWTRIETLRDAVVRLGGARLLDLVLGNYLERLKISAPMYDLAEGDLWLHSAAASLAVKALKQERPSAGVADIAAVAALVHDIGKLVMVRYLKADVREILRVRDDHKLSFAEAERELFGFDHAEVGGAMATKWGFPDEVADAITNHHQVPVQNPSPTVDAVVIANLAAKAIGTGLGAEGMDLRLDEQVHRRLGLNFSGFSRICIQTKVWLDELKVAYGVK